MSAVAGDPGQLLRWATANRRRARRVPAPVRLRALPARHAGRGGAAGRAGQHRHPASPRRSSGSATAHRGTRCGCTSLPTATSTPTSPCWPSAACRPPRRARSRTAPATSPTRGRPARSPGIGDGTPGHRAGHRPDHARRGDRGDGAHPRTVVHAVSRHALLPRAHRRCAGAGPADLAARAGQPGRPGAARRADVAGPHRDGGPPGGLGGHHGRAPAARAPAVAAAARGRPAALPPARRALLGGAPAPDAAGDRAPGRRAARHRAAVGARAARSGAVTAGGPAGCGCRIEHAAGASRRACDGRLADQRHRPGRRHHPHRRPAAARPVRPRAGPAGPAAARPRRHPERRAASTRRDGRGTLFTLGPPLRGLRYETTAIPEIRAQAAALALRLTAAAPVPARPDTAA